MIKNFSLSSEDLSRTARGEGNAAVLELLRAVQLSKHMLLIRMISEHVGDDLWRDAFAVFRATEGSPAAARVLGDPWTGAWAVGVMRALGAGEHPSGRDILHFNALATVVALDARVDADLVLPVYRGVVFLPGRGCVLLGRNVRRCDVRIREGEASVLAPDQSVAIPAEQVPDGPSWQTLRRLVTEIDGKDHAVAFDDLSPYRRSFLLPVSTRLSAEELQAWHRPWHEAWSLLGRYAPTRVGELARCIATVVPLSNRSRGTATSATTRDAFAACAMSLPPDGANMAIALVHESRHTMLNALLDLVDLYQDSEGMYFAPWRNDPRPIGGLLHGAFAFTGIAELWYGLSADTTLEEMSLRQFAIAREQVATAIDFLERAPELNDKGQLFAAGIRHNLDSLLEVALPRYVVSRARAIVRQTHADWLARTARKR